MRTTYEYESNDYGTILIQEDENKKCTVWLDPEQCCEGVELAFVDDDDFQYWKEEFFSDVDFSDLPKEDGEFENHNEAKEYIESKFVKIN